MPRAHTDNGRVELRLRPEDKATLERFPLMHIHMRILSG